MRTCSNLHNIPETYINLFPDRTWNMGCIHSKPPPKPHPRKPRPKKRKRKPIVIVDDPSWREDSPDRRERRYQDESKEVPDLDRYMRSMQAPLPRHFEKGEMRDELKEVGGYVKRVGKRRV
ncbi:hypothetical protein P3342_011031 [Pyrenophora teres f. teres]|nr:hypothetical protein P3342_011031 [Pyrenophora teres f. teres]